MLCKSPNTIVFCWLDLIDTNIRDGDIIPGSRQNDNPEKNEKTTRKVQYFQYLLHLAVTIT